MIIIRNSSLVILVVGVLIGIVADMSFHVVYAVPPPVSLRFELRDSADSEVLTAAKSILEELDRRFDVQVTLPGEKLCKTFLQKDDGETEAYDNCLKAFGMGDSADTNKGLDGINYLVAVTTANENDNSSSSKNQTSPGPRLMLESTPALPPLENEVNGQTEDSHDTNTTSKVSAAENQSEISKKQQTIGMHRSNLRNNLTCTL